MGGRWRILRILGVYGEVRGLGRGGGRERRRAGENAASRERTGIAPARSPAVGVGRCMSAVRRSPGVCVCVCVCEFCCFDQHRPR